MDNKGFTLMEIIIVIGIVTIVGGSFLFVDLGTYRGEAFRAEGKQLVVALQIARANAMNNVDQSKHGVVILPADCDGYAVFEGNHYVPGDEKNNCIRSNYKVLRGAGSITEIVFSQLSGDADKEGQIILTDPQRSWASTTISVNYEGKIAL